AAASALVLVDQVAQRLREDAGLVIVALLASSLQVARDLEQLVGQLSLVSGLQPGHEPLRAPQQPVDLALQPPIGGCQFLAALCLVGLTEPLPGSRDLDALAAIRVPIDGRYLDQAVDVVVEADDDLA